MRDGLGDEVSGADFKGTWIRTRGPSSALLSSFYRTAEELGKLDSVLQLSLSQAEEREFVAFLESASKAHAREVLLMYYLQRARFSEAMQLNQQMAEAGIGGTARQAIMARYVLLEKIK